MQALIWKLQNGGIALFAPMVASLALMFVLCPDYVFLLAYRLYEAVRARTERNAEPPASPPTLVVIPSLLRVRDELDSMMSTVTSILENGYRGDLTVVVSIDGTDDAPALYAELKSWAKGRPTAKNHRLWITGTRMRRSKPMAIDHGIEFVKRQVARGLLPAFPPVYVSTDADADLGPDALEAIVHRLHRRNPFTGAPARAVAGALHVRGDDFWKGIRHFFSVAGQLNLQVAREYYVGNMWRHNIRWLPITGVPGAFYCTWSEIFLSIPKLMGYMRTLRTRDWLGWWVGIRPPMFSESTAAPIAELMAGDTDDTVTAYAAVLVRWENGRFSFDPPRTPLHALAHLLKGYFVDRALQYEPRAKVFTSSPTSIKTLFKQRKRWNSSRVELTGRFWPALGYHWTLGLPAMVVMGLVARTLVVGIAVYGRLPAMVMSDALVVGFVTGYVAALVNYALSTFFAMAVNGGFRYWRMMLAVLLAPLYQLVFNWLPGAVGVISDTLLFGNRTGFAPESTLIRGGSRRIALAFRLRRAFLLTVRAAFVGDVPLGAFWLGWDETPWTPSGFEGYTSKKAPRSILRAPPRFASMRPRLVVDNVTTAAPASTPRREDIDLAA